RCGFGALSVLLLLTGMPVASSSNPAVGQEQRRAAKPQREPIRVGGNVQESKLFHRVEPVYPPEASAARISGVVILQVTVNEAGGSVVISPHPSVPFRILEETLRALQKAGATEMRLTGPYTFREGRLYYTDGSGEIQAPELALEKERLAAVAKNSGRTESAPATVDGRKVLLYHFFVSG